MTCSEVHEAAAEYALDILDSPGRAAVAAHLIRCPECRREVDAMQESANKLLDLVPGTEPPLGFDERVMNRFGTPARPARRTFRVIASLAAAALLIVASTFGVELAQSHRPDHSPLAGAELLSNGNVVGQVYMYAGRPPSLEMTVKGMTAQGPINCVVVTDAGAASIGSFELHHGWAYWAASDKSGLNGITRVQLVDETGHVLASASFS
jgi:hypothetical protein